jgi:hypothetical protein
MAVAVTSFLIIDFLLYCFAIFLPPRCLVTERNNGKNNSLPPVNGKKAGILFNAPLRGISALRQIIFLFFYKKIIYKVLNPPEYAESVNKCDYKCPPESQARKQSQPDNMNVGRAQERDK